MAKRKAFGISQHLNEGISQTINAAKNNAGELRYEVIPLTKIQFDADNPRKLAISATELLGESIAPTDPCYEQKRHELEQLRSLAHSIQKSGVRNAIEVYKDGINYRLISGERRVLGSILAGKKDIQARIIDTKPSEYDIRYLQWIENIEREDLSIWEKLLNIRQLVVAYQQQQQVEVTATILKDILGCSLPHAMTYMAILHAPPDVEALLQEQVVTNLEKAALLAKTADPQTRSKLIIACVEQNCSLLELKKMRRQASEIIPKTLQVRSNKKQGRKPLRIALGHTEKIEVVKQLMSAILEKTPYQDFAGLFKDVDWKDFTAVSRAFQSLLKLMEAR